MNHLIAIGNYMMTHVLSIVLAIVVSYIIGFLWHGPIFGKLWMNLNGIKPPKKEDMKFSMMLPGLTANLILVVAISAVLGRAFQIVSMGHISDALIIATIIWFPFNALFLANQYAWMGKPFKLTVVDSAHAWIQMLAIASVLFYTL